MGRRKRLDGKSYEEIVSRRRTTWSRVMSTSSTRRSNNWEQVKKFSILDSDFSIENGELTPA